MDLFMDFFRIKTGIDWEDRVIKHGTTPLTVFQYSPPVSARPDFPWLDEGMVGTVADIAKTGGKPIGRRLRHSYDYCLEINAQLRGLPWPPPKDAPGTTVDGDKEEADDSKTHPRDESEEKGRIEEDDGEVKENSSLATGHGRGRRR